MHYLFIIHNPFYFFIRIVHMPGNLIHVVWIKMKFQYF